MTSLADRGAWVKRIAIALLCVAFAGCASVAQTDSVTPEQALTRLFTTPKVKRAWFAKEIWSTNFVDRVVTLRDGYLDSLGALEGIRESERFWLLDFPTATVPAYIRLNAQGAISTLWFNLNEPRNGPTLAEIESVLPEFGGSVSLLIERDGETLFAHNADNPLAVGSAFKIVVLQALRDEVGAGRLSASEQLTLKASQKSLPSGSLHTEPTGSVWSPDDLAVRMISKSDNTATDMLIEAVGADTLDVLSPRNAPFLTTNALFKLKDPENAALLAQWRGGSVGDRRAVLGELVDRPLPPIDIFSNGPVALDVEWFFSAHELCSHLNSVGFDPAMVINPGHLDAARWARVAYKGGSEPGVFNQSFLLESAAGQRSCVVGTWNQPDGMVTLPFMRLMSHLARIARELP